MAPGWRIPFLSARGSGLPFRWFLARASTIPGSLIRRKFRYYWSFTAASYAVGNSLPKLRQKINAEAARPGLKIFFMEKEGNKY
ncbi:hypothetical protein [Paenibacillus chitinolyticus]|uniref:Uncharacterized protein n=1 Tax=Paenibacillus chitinolyticus TaxID=79263 RepID=A0ABT4FBW4_9BACL|nr:hypothetical protein [Paenibacillus chitinolyticus]MCY9591649.1 hypothetical protein [Paenibacillus chitinolyticus]MCY9596008.1 hypothetical protein [Paenibacillus chitinolyticus]